MWPLLPLLHNPVHHQHLPPMVHLLLGMKMHEHVIITQSPQFTSGLTLGVGHSVCLDKSGLTSIHHHRVHVVASRFSCVWLFATLIGYSPLGSSVHGMLQVRILEWVAVPSSSGGSSWTRVIQSGFTALKTPCVPPLFLSPWQPLVFTVSIVLAFSRMSYVGTIQDIAFADWLLSLRNAFTFPMSFYDLIALFHLVLSNVPLSGLLLSC